MLSYNQFRTKHKGSGLSIKQVSSLWKKYPKKTTVHKPHPKIICSYEHVFEKSKVIILGDGIQYPNNAGTLVRHTSLLGVDAIFFSPLDELRLNKIAQKKDYMVKGFVKKNDKWIYSNNFIKSLNRISSGYHQDICIIYNKNIKNIIEQALEHNFEIFMLENYVDADIRKVNLKSNKIMLILGNETLGVGNVVQKYYDDGLINPLFIPSCIRGKSSFNVANAGIIAMYERYRQVGCILYK
uniref:rRNA methylase family protein n=1 Tax=Pithovirus LCPAC001 TaxID=2506585 RepID=A0A481Z2G8_9VIRU|nr:MAG: rRNA methylase family protein [Pithovirus LCPAC001]